MASKHAAALALKTYFPCAHTGCKLVFPSKTAAARHMLAYSAHPSCSEISAERCAACGLLVELGLWRLDCAKFTRRDDHVCAHDGCGHYSASPRIAQRRQALERHTRSYPIHSAHFAARGSQCAQCAFENRNGVWTREAETWRTSSRQLHRRLRTKERDNAHGVIGPIRPLTAALGEEVKVDLLRLHIIPLRRMWLGEARIASPRKVVKGVLMPASAPITNVLGKGADLHTPRKRKRKRKRTRKPKHQPRRAMQVDASLATAAAAAATATKKKTKIVTTDETSPAQYFTAIPSAVSPITNALPIFCTRFMANTAGAQNTYIETTASLLQMRTDMLIYYGEPKSCAQETR